MADPNIAVSRTESPATQSFHTFCIEKVCARAAVQRIADWIEALRQQPYREARPQVAPGLQLS